MHHIPIIQAKNTVLTPILATTRPDRVTTTSATTRLDRITPISTKTRLDRVTTTSATTRLDRITPISTKTQLDRITPTSAKTLLISIVVITSLIIHMATQITIRQQDMVKKSAVHLTGHGNTRRKLNKCNVNFTISATQLMTISTMKHKKVTKRITALITLNMAVTAI